MADMADLDKNLGEARQAYDAAVDAAGEAARNTASAHDNYIAAYAEFANTTGSAEDYEKLKAAEDLWEEAQAQERAAQRDVQTAANEVGTWENGIASAGQPEVTLEELTQQAESADQAYNDALREAEDAYNDYAAVYDEYVNVGGTAEDFNRMSQAQERAAEAQRELEDAEAARNTAQEAAETQAVREAKLSDLEGTLNVANRKTRVAMKKLVKAEEKTAAAYDAYLKASDALAWSDPNDPEAGKAAIKAFEDAEKAWRDAQEEEGKAREAAEKAAAAAQDAWDDVETKKEYLRATRVLDNSYVVYGARVECTCGMRESCLALDNTHGVKICNVHQLTAKDTVPNKNVINFGGCTSLENPTVRAAAEAAAEDANETIHSEERWGFRDWIVSLFTKKKDIEVSESLMEICMGECTPEFPAGADWSYEHEKVYINGEPALLRRCSLMCNFGGQVTILVSGQPE